MLKTRMVTGFVRRSNQWGQILYAKVVAGTDYDENKITFGINFSYGNSYSLCSTHVGSNTNAILALSSRTTSGLYLRPRDTGTWLYIATGY